MDIRTYESIGELELHARRLRSAYITALIHRAFIRLLGSNAGGEPADIQPSEIALERH
ncbi:MAG: hypothetical protein R3337_08995 [Gammaproteobacteria bacterium]|nr:hypothetical protein [Gammaproteobacteria bacterium]